MTTTDPHEALAARGVVRLERFVPGATARAAREALGKQLERLGIRARGKWHLKRFEGLPSFQLAGQIARSIGADPAFDALFTDALRELVERLAGARFPAAHGHTQLLVTPPQREPWSVPHAGWHLDVAATGTLPGIQAFVLIDDIAPRGGATMAVAGSHQLARAPGGVHGALRGDRVFGALFEASAPDRDALLQEHARGDVRLQVIEMCGRAGDVYLMDMRVLHAPSTNSTSRARMAATRRYIKP